jgi:hypothetical protein
VTATSETNHTQPRSLWNQLEVKYITKNVRRQLGGTNETLTHQDRGILSITRESLYNAIEKVVKPTDLRDEGDDDGYFTGHETGNIAFCAECNDDDTYERTHAFWEYLFSEVIDETDSPALAIQAANTVSARMAYTRWLPGFTKAGAANITTFIEARIPVRVFGYSTVVGLIGLQLALLVTVGLAFRRSRNSILNNIWLVVSQVSSSPETADILAQASTMTDAEVKTYTYSEERAKLLGRDRGSSGQTAKFVIRDGTFRPTIWNEEIAQDFRWRRWRRGSTV